MAAAIKEATGIEAELIPGKGGVFDIEADGRLIYSKHKTLQFPSDQEILEQLQ